MRLVFGEWTLDAGSRLLMRDGQPVHLTPKAFDLLRVLIEHRPAAIPKAVIHDTLWPSTFVSESNLSSLVSELRSLLGDEPRRPRFLRTVHGYGYAFCGQATELPASRPKSAHAVVFRLLFRGREVPLVAGVTTLGRDPESALWLDLDQVSRHHAEIVVDGATATLMDLGSRNGTLLNGIKVTAAQPLHDGDIIELAGEPLTLRAISRAHQSETKPAGGGGAVR